MLKDKRERIILIGLIGPQTDKSLFYFLHSLFLLVFTLVIHSFPSIEKLIHPFKAAGSNRYTSRTNKLQNTMQSLQFTIEDVYKRQHHNRDRTVFPVLVSTHHPEHVHILLHYRFWLNLPIHLCRLHYAIRAIN